MGIFSAYKDFAKNPFSKKAFHRQASTNPFLGDITTNNSKYDSHGDLIIDPGTPAGDQLGQIQQQQQAMYNQVYRPAAQKLIKDVNSTALVDSAKATASVDNTEINYQRGVRQRARMGVTATAGQNSAADYNTKLGTTLTNDGNINRAHIVQKERNDALLGDLVNVSRGISTDAINSASSAAGSEGQRDANNANIAAQNKAQQNQTRGSIAAMAIMMMM